MHAQQFDGPLDAFAQNLAYEMEATTSIAVIHAEY